MPPKPKSDKPAAKVAQSAHEIAEIGNPTDTPQVTFAPTLVAPAPQAPPLVAPAAAKLATDAILASTPPPEVKLPAGILKKPEPEKPTPATPTPGAKSPGPTTPAPALLKPPNEDIARQRSICIRKIKKYGEVFKKETAELIPLGDLRNHTNDQLEAICMACDSVLGDSFGRETICTAVLAILTPLDRYLLPRVQAGRVYQGVSHVAEQMILDKETSTPLSRAVDRLAIKYTGRIETNAEVGLLLSMWSVFQETAKINLQNGYMDIAPAHHESANVTPDIDYSNL